jgi:RNA polymerase sigma-70 factor, ECF subfamily
MIGLMPTLGEQEARLKSLMLAGLAGDNAAHAALLKALAEALRRYYGRRLGRGAADVEDLVQETLIAVHVRRGTYAPDAPLTAWAYAIARYKLIDFYRREGRRRTAPLEAAEALFSEDDTEGWMAGSDLDRLLGTLEPKAAALIRHTKIEGLSTREAASRTGLSESAVKVSVHRSLKKLIARFGARSGKEGDLVDR